MKKAGCWFLVFLVLFSSASLIRSSGRGTGNWENPYLDVSDKRWSYDAIMALSRAGILPVSEDQQYEPGAVMTRAELALYLYNMDKEVFPDQRKAREKAQKKQDLPQANFTDVTKESPYYDAVAWAYKNGLISGSSAELFVPERALRREEICTIVARFVEMEGLTFAKTAEPDQFVDSLRIQDWARSSVTACQMAGFITGKSDGYFDPADTMTREACATVLYRLMTALDAEPEKGEDGEAAAPVNFAPGAYDSLYRNYEDIPYTTLIAKDDLDPKNYFDKTVFIGDSISLALEYYCTASGALGSAQFLCAGNMSPTNILTGQVLPEYPKGSGQKPSLEESVAATGAKVVYIMLGMDGVGYYGIDQSVEDMVTVVENIKSASPDVAIVLQSVTPMSDSSNVKSEKLNNDVIEEYNQRLYNLCKSNHWYYLNVAEAVRDEEGYLRREYCSDYGKMGLHMTSAGAEVWIDYLKTHIPAPLLREVTH